MINSLELLVNLLCSQGRPLINSQSAVLPWIILLEQSLVLSLLGNREIMLLWNRQELIHHGWELCHLDDPILVQVVVSEDLQQVPVQLHMFWTGGRRFRRSKGSFTTARYGSLDEGLVLVHTSMVNDGMRIHGSSLGSDVLPAELEPFIKGDDTSGLEIHGVKHLLSGCILLCLSLVQLRILRSITIGSGHGCSSINQLGEGSSANKTISVGVSIHEQLQERMIHLRMRVTLLVCHSSLHEPDEVLLGLVEGVHWARHLGNISFVSRIL